MVEPSAQGAGGFHVVAVVGEEPVASGTSPEGPISPNGLVVADHRLATAGILDLPGKAAQRGHVLQPGRAAGDELALEYAQQIYPLTRPGEGGDRIHDADVRTRRSHGRGEA